MKLRKPSYKIIEQEPSINGIYKMIEYAGRVCYKSEDKITENSAKSFVDRMIKSGHNAMLEHGTLYFKIPVNIDVAGNFLDEVPIWTKCRLAESKEGNWWAVTTNLRVMIERFTPEYLKELIEKYLCEPTEYHEKRICVKFICDRGVSHEFVRHRVFSFAQESTRYCNYSKDKFSGELTFIKPSWDMTFKFNEYEEDKSLPFLLSNIETEYNHLINDYGWKPQQARMILPNCIKTELIMTGFVQDWKYFFSLRALGTTGAPHPQAKELAEPLMNEFINRGYINGLA